MKRIVILGCAGSGKTVLALALGREAKLPVISLDSIWERHWTENDVPAFRALITRAHAGDAWISDGNFAQASFDIRLPRADLIVWLERSRLMCAGTRDRPNLRSDDGHDLRDLPKVLSYIRIFERVNRPLIEAERLAHGAHVPVLRPENDSAAADFVRSMRDGQCRIPAA